MLQKAMSTFQSWSMRMSSHLFTSKFFTNDLSQKASQFGQNLIFPSEASHKINIGALCFFTWISGCQKNKKSCHVLLFESKTENNVCGREASCLLPYGCPTFDSKMRRFSKGVRQEWLWNLLAPTGTHLHLLWNTFAALVETGPRFSWVHMSHSMQTSHSSSNFSVLSNGPWLQRRSRVFRNSVLFLQLFCIY